MMALRVLPTVGVDDYDEDGVGGEVGARSRRESGRLRRCRRA